MSRFLFVGTEYCDAQHPSMVHHQYSIAVGLQELCSFQCFDLPEQFFHFFKYFHCSFKFSVSFCVGGLENVSDHLLHMLLCLQMTSRNLMFIFAVETALASRVTLTNFWVKLCLYFYWVHCRFFQVGHVYHYILTNVLHDLTSSCIFLMEYPFASLSTLGVFSTCLVYSAISIYLSFFTFCII